MFNSWLMLFSYSHYVWNVIIVGENCNLYLKKLYQSIWLVSAWWNGYKQLNIDILSYIIFWTRIGWISKEFIIIWRRKKFSWITYFKINPIRYQFLFWFDITFESCNVNKDLFFTNGSIKMHCIINTKFNVQGKFQFSKQNNA